MVCRHYTRSRLISKGCLGIEVTTGPLGQGFGNGVGLAMAQAHLAALFNKDGFDLIDNYTYGKTARCIVSGQSLSLVYSFRWRWVSYGGCSC